MIVNEEVWGCNPKFKKGDETSDVRKQPRYITFSLNELDTSQSQAGMAVQYSRIGLPVFPCDSNKVPIMDHSLNLIHGLKDATTDPRIAAKIWYKYPGAAIGFAIPSDIVIIDCDVKKDDKKRPVLKDGLPEMTGLRSYQGLVIEFNITGAELQTMSVKTQSGGRHFYYKMPDGIPSFNRTGALTGLDIKGFGGYVILPNSLGSYGKYEFLNRSEIRQIPESLLQWILRFRRQTKNVNSIPTGTGNVDREEIIRILEPYWAKADGRRNEFTLAIAGFIARSGGNEQDAVHIVSKLCDLTKKGYDHISGSKYAFRRNGSVKGLRSLLKLMEEIANEKQ